MINIIQLEKQVNEFFFNRDPMITHLLKSGEIEFRVIENITHPMLVCKNKNKVIAEVLFDPYNKFFYIKEEFEKFNNVMFPFEKGHEEVIEYFRQALAEEYDLDCEETNERSKILSKLSDFASLLKEERGKEKERIGELGPIKWISDEELVSSEKMDLPFNKETKTFVQLGYMERSEKYVLIETIKTYMDKELLDVSQSAFKFQTESVEIIKNLLKRVLGKEI